MASIAILALYSYNKPYRYFGFYGFYKVNSQYDPYDSIFFNSNHSCSWHNYHSYCKYYSSYVNPGYCDICSRFDTCEILLY